MRANEFLSDAVNILRPAAEVDVEDGIDPFNHDGRLPDSFPNNPESAPIEGRDESPPVVFDAEQAALEAKRGLLLPFFCSL